jgi:heptaprenyl diphosphate synthase
MNNKINKIAFFAGLSAFIGVFENFIPMPVPFLRLGLSNVPVLFCFSLFNYYECIYIVLFKVVFSHLFRGTIFSYLFFIALSGNLFFILLSYPLFHLIKRHTSFISISLLSSFFHNTGQLVASTLFIPLQAVFYISILIISVGIILGFINGVICNIIYNKVFMRYFFTND